MGNTVSSMKRFFKSFSSGNRIDKIEGLNAAIRAASNGKYWSYNSLLSSFTADWTKAVKNGGVSPRKFVETYCGMNFNNTDTGSVIGSDAGGKTAYSKATIVADTVPMSKWKLPTSNKTVIEGCTFVWSKTKNLSAKEQYLLKGLNSSWLKGALNLINKSYGLSFKNDMAKCKTITVNFVKDNDLNRSAWVSASGGNYANKISLNINVKSDFNTKSIHGEVKAPSGYQWTGGPNYTDVNLAHELVHALVFSSVPGALWSDFMTGLSEGLAEFVIGVDNKDRLQNIEYMFSKSNFSKFKTTMTFGTRTNYTNSFYGPATALLRYMTKNGLADSYRYTNAKKTAMALTSAFSGTYKMSSWKGVMAVNARENKKTITINGTSAANTIHVGIGTDTVSAGAGNDTLTVIGGKGHKISMNAGNDKMTFAKATASFVYGNDGADTITVTSGSNNKFYGFNHNDTLTVSGGKDSYFYGGNGRDTIVVSGGSNNRLYGQNDNDIIKATKGTNNFVWGNAGNDFFTIAGTTSSRFYGNEGVDTFNLTSGTSNIIHGQEANDIINVKGGKSNIANGSLGRDTLTLTAGTANRINGNEDIDTLSISGGTDGIASGNDGNDILYVKAGTNNKIYGNDGNDKLYIQGGTGSYASGNLGDDIITISAGKSGFAYGGDGNDKLYVSAGTGYLVNAQTGNDVIQVTGGSSNKYYGSDGNDTYNIKGGTDDTYYAGQGNNVFNVDAFAFKGKSVISLKGYDTNAINTFRFKGQTTDTTPKAVGFIEDYSFTKEGANLVISNANSSITINDWDNHKSSVLYFADGSKRTYNAIESMMNFPTLV